MVEKWTVLSKKEKKMSSDLLTDMEEKRKLMTNRKWKTILLKKFEELNKVLKLIILASITFTTFIVFGFITEILWKTYEADDHSWFFTFLIQHQTIHCEFNVIWKISADDSDDNWLFQ
ncbi:hypothetical protein SNEBB_009521 [Seison nebaliae]|nr:hypothetical protein SNEBB_009521 [Seison nebaliae]